MEQYTACVHAAAAQLPRHLLLIFFARLMQQQWMQWGLYAQQYASMYSFPSQPVNGAGYVHTWESDVHPGASGTDSHAHRSL